jgi:hypothetical protein
MPLGLTRTSAVNALAHTVTEDCRGLPGLIG